MERLRKRDAEAGVSTRPITDEQRAAIAEVRSLSDSKIAEQNMSSPANFASQFRRERERLASERDAKVEKLRQGAD